MRLNSEVITQKEQIVKLENEFGQQALKLRESESTARKLKQQLDFIDKEILKARSDVKD